MCETAQPTVDTPSYINSLLYLIYLFIHRLYGVGRFQNLNWVQVLATFVLYEGSPHKHPSLVSSLNFRLFICTNEETEVLLASEMPDENQTSKQQSCDGHL